ncbi:MAG: FlxA-like family protein [Lachnospiraceae bacterium]|nr:FlxA-like family protein [Lachnospiraceae bacterium]
MKKQRITRKLYAAGWIAAILCNMAGCAATPDSGIVTQKNNERLKEAARQGADEDNNLSAVARKTQEHYDYSYENADRTLQVTADADIWIPDKDSIPMYEVEGGRFSQELVTRTYDYFFQGEETYTYEGTDLTKAGCEEEILKLKQELARLSDDEVDSEEYIEQQKEFLQQEIQDLQEAYEQAPEESTLKEVPVASTLTDQEVYTANGKEYIPGVTCQNAVGSFDVINYPPDSSAWSYMHYTGKGEYNYSGRTGTALTSEEEKKTAEKEIGLSYENAKKIVDDFFSEIGVEAEECAVSAVAGRSEKELERAPEEPDSMEDADHYTAYEFFYTRTVDDIPFAGTASGLIGDDEAALIWCYERIEIFVEPKGIVWFQWEFPVEVKGNVAEDVGIISFAEASDIFEKMMPVIYEGELESENTASIDVRVHSVKLALMRVRDSGGDRTGLLTPTWVFYGSVDEQYHAYNEYTEKWEDWENSEEEPYIVLAVNAVDGSVIDIIEGY